MSDGEPINFVAARIADAVRRHPHGAFSNPSVTVERERFKCPHTEGSNLIVDCQSRKVTCSLCGAELDAFDALVLCVHAERFAAQRSQDLLKARVAELEGLESQAGLDASRLTDEVRRAQRYRLDLEQRFVRLTARASRLATECRARRAWLAAKARFKTGMYDTRGDFYNAANATYQAARAAVDSAGDLEG